MRKAGASPYRRVGSSSQRDKYHILQRKKNQKKIECRLNCSELIDPTDEENEPAVH
jgi:hypothetical protein